MSYEQLTEKHLNRLKDAISETIKNKGLNDTGGAVSSLEVNGNQLLGNDYIYYLDKGRKPGKFPPIQTLRDWVRRKLGVTDKEVNGIAYVIGRKIANEGTRIFRQPEKGIELDKLINNTLEELYKELPETAYAEVKAWL